MPVIAPVAESKDKPSGSVPDCNDQLYGFVPPVAVRVAEYATPTFPLCKAEVRTTGGASGFTTRLRLLELDESLSASVTSKIRDLAVPGAVGVPLMAPAALKDTPAGRAPDFIDQ